MLRFIVESDSFDRCATNRQRDDKSHGTLRVPTQRKEYREARSHAGSSMHATTQRSKRSKHTTREATKDTMLKILKHATNHLTANMQTRMCEDTKDTKDTEDRVDTTRKRPSTRPRTCTHSRDTDDREDTTRKLANETTLPTPPTHAKSCVITRNPNPSQRQHAYATVHT